MRIFFFCLFLFTFLFSQNNTYKVSFEHFKYKFKNALRYKYHIDEKSINEIFKNTHFLKHIIKKDRNQLHTKISLQKYLKLIVSSDRVKIGKIKYKKYNKLLKKISHHYKVPAEFIVALWGVESYYGKLQGKEIIIDAFLTLIYDGRREKFFKDELLHTIKILKDNNFKKEDIKGSWAGAMGACQFMPSSYLAFAQDWDRDGVKDIWNNKGDIFASTANYLSKHKFKFDEPIALEIYPPSHFKSKKLSMYNLEGIYKIKYKNKKFASKYDKHIKGTIKQYKNKYFVVFDNLDVIKKWNNSDYFAISVALLGNKIKYK